MSRQGWLVAASVLTVVGASCGGVAGATRGWCEAVGDLDSAIAQVDPADPAVVRARFVEADELARRLRTGVPDGLERDAEVVAAATEQATASGEIGFLDEPVADAMRAVHWGAAQTCLYEDVSVVASDYAYELSTASVPAGRVSLAFDNESTVEAHELVLFRKRDGVTEPLADLLALPESEAMGKVEMIAFTTAGPTERTGLILDLTSGDYGIVCFIPTGGVEGAAPHFVHGMIADFTVG